MRYLLFTALMLINLVGYADKKKDAKKSEKKTETKSKESKTVTSGNEPNFHSKLEYNQPGSPLFELKGSNINGEEITLESIPAGNLIVMLYNPDCGHCLEESKKLRDNMAKFPETQILFLSGHNTAPIVPDFMKQIENPDGSSNLMFATIDQSLTDQIFDYNGIPQIMVYNANHTLEKIFYKNADISEITNLLNR